MVVLFRRKKGCSILIVKIIFSFLDDHYTLLQPYSTHTVVSVGLSLSLYSVHEQRLRSSSYTDLKNKDEDEDDDG